jgi:hypothetical protein
MLMASPITVMGAKSTVPLEAVGRVMGCSWPEADRWAKTSAPIAKAIAVGRTNGWEKGGGEEERFIVVGIVSQ